MFQLNDYLSPTPQPVNYTPMTPEMLASTQSYLSELPQAPLGFMDQLKDTFSLKNLLNSYDKKTGQMNQGWGSLGLGAVTGLGQLYLGMKNYGIAKDTLNFQKDSWAKEYAAQRQLTNSRMEDRQAARVASNAGAYESVGSYMNKNKVV